MGAIIVRIYQDSAADRRRLSFTYNRGNAIDIPGVWPAQQARWLYRSLRKHGSSAYDARRAIWWPLFWGAICHGEERITFVPYTAV